MQYFRCVGGNGRPHEVELRVEAYYLAGFIFSIYCFAGIHSICSWVIPGTYPTGRHSSNVANLMSEMSVSEFFELSRSGVSLNREVNRKILAFFPEISDPAIVACWVVVKHDTSQKLLLVVKHYI